MRLLFFARWGAIVLVVGAVQGGALAAQDPLTATFPGPTKTLSAPGSRAQLFYVDPGENKDGLHLYSLRLRYSSGRVDWLDVFERSVDVAWSPSGAHLFVNDYVGSNVSDCLAVSPSERGTRGVSLTGVLRRAGRPEVTRALKGDHVYVTCAGWEAATKVRVEMRGDVFPETFAYAFVYDLKSGTLTSVAGG